MQTPLATLKKRMAAICGDAEFARLGPGLDCTARLACDGESFAIRMTDGTIAIIDKAPQPDILIEAARDDWARLVSDPVPPSFHAFTALQLANPAFSVSGDPLALGRARPTLERLFERSVIASRPTLPTVERDLAQITGRYASVSIAGTIHPIYWEEAGGLNASTPPVVFLHTAGADSRQFLGQMSDTALAREHRLIAFDLPFHGRSLPPDGWDGGAYRLTENLYLEWCAAFIETVVGAPVIIAGGSMGAAMALTIAARRPDLAVGIVAIEPPFRARGRKNAAQQHVGVHGSLHNASFVRGLMSPFSPEADRRRASWIYAQGAPGIYPGDLAFYSEEFDGDAIARSIDTAKTPIALLCGAYDYSASPDDGRKLHALMPDAHFAEMPTLGHFPMTEDPDAFRPFLLDALSHITSSKR